MAMRYFRCGRAIGSDSVIGNAVAARDMITASDFVVLIVGPEAVTPLEAAHAALGISCGKPLVLGTGDRPWENEETCLLRVSAQYVFDCLDETELARLAGVCIGHNPDNDRIDWPWAKYQSRLLDKCESPAETRLLVHLLNQEPACPGTLYAQHEVNVDGHRYRADFAIVGHQNPEIAKAFNLAIEVDGHDFHERTKEQAARDRSRDRAMLINGWHVLRFTGSEVWRGPAACARQAVDMAEKLSAPEEDHE